MARGYEFFEHTADVGVRVYGETWTDLFTNAAHALYATLGEFQKSETVCCRLLDLTALSREDLLHDWLTELLFDFSAHEVLYDKFLFLNCASGRLVVELCGGVVDFARSNPREEIKAVTYHQLEVTQTPRSPWVATVIFDV